MADDPRSEAAPTRRRYLATAGALAGGGLLAGCLGGDSTPADETTGDQSPTGDTPTEDPSSTGTGGPTGTARAGSSEATLSPAGTISLDAPPESVMVYNLLYADMAVAYGYGDAVNSLGFSTDAAGSIDAYYARLDGVSFAHEELTQLNSGSGTITVDEELFYDLDSELHLVDPALMVSFDGWDEADVETVREEVAPFFGNNYSRNNTEPPAPYAAEYEYYTLWEIAERVATVFQVQARYAQLKEIRDDLVARIQADLPPEAERPSVASVIYVDGTFYPATLKTAGFANAHTRPLEPVDAFADGDVGYQSSYDMEKLLTVDPDVILHRYGYSYYDVPAIEATLAEHTTGQQIAAVENGRVYADGHPMQGPLMNLFQLEMAAKQLYPEQFGEWPGYDPGAGAYPEIPEGEQLFDRAAVAGIVDGSG